MTDTYIGDLADGGPLRTTDALPVERDAANCKVTLAGSAALAPLLPTDLVPVVRGGVVYLATVADLLAAAGPGGQLDFSDPTNSAFAAII